MPIFDSIFTPLTRKPRKLADEYANALDPEYGEGGKMKGFIAGAMQGAGDVMSDMTSPFSLATSAIPALGRIKNLGSVGKLIKPSTDLATKMKKKIPIGDDVDLSSAFDKPAHPDFEPPAGFSQSVKNPKASPLSGNIEDRFAKMKQVRERSARLKPSKFNDEMLSANPLMGSRRTEDIELTSLPNLPEKPKNPFVRNDRTPDKKLVYGGAEGWLPSEIAMESVGPLSNEVRVGNYLGDQAVRQWKDDDNQMRRYFQGKSSRPGPRTTPWKTR